MLPIYSILHPTDFSMHSEYAYRFACSLARDHGARMIVLHVVSRLPREVAVWDLFQRSREYREVLEERLHMLAAPDPQVPMEYVLEDGDPAKQIVHAAQEHKCDLIVMGTHGRTGLNRLLLGSVAEEVVRKAPCAVLIMKPPQAGVLPSWDRSPEEAVQRMHAPAPSPG
jgi:nucleotide-binding universal stress UspA family protein